MIFVLLTLLRRTLLGDESAIEVVLNGLLCIHMLLRGIVRLTSHVHHWLPRGFMSAAMLQCRMQWWLTLAAGLGAMIVL